MMQLIGLLTGGYGPLVIIGALLLVSNTGTAFLTHKVDSAKLERFKAVQAQQAAHDNAVALLQLQAHEAAANKALNEMAKVKAAREVELTTLRKAIKNAPKTRGCVDSPAIHALVDGLRSGSSKHN